MTDTLTPVLSAFWDADRSWSLETYEANRGYEALRIARRIIAHEDAIMAQQPFR